MRPDSKFCLEQMGNCLSACTKRPEDQSPSPTDLCLSSVTGKDGVHTCQPGAAHCHLVVSIATQTDPVQIFTPVLAKKPEENGVTNPLSSSDSDEDLSSLSPTEVQPGTGLRWFSNHKNCDLDMDIYRSCRKLSVLPEENDEGLNRIPSFKNNLIPKTCGDQLTSSFKTQSADDVTTINKLSHNSHRKQVSSCSNIVLTSYRNSDDSILSKPRTSFSDLQASSSPRSKIPPPLDITPPDQPDPDDDSPVKNSNELQLPVLDSKDTIWQPHSFESYLDPQQIQSSALERQISDPTQSTASAPLVNRRGSYIRRPRSTCRPLRLPCGKNDESGNEERVFKVRFDLSDKVNVKQSETANGLRGPIQSSLKKTEKPSIISRFKVEVVDEDEFRKSLEQPDPPIQEEPSRIRKRPPLVHAVHYKKSVLRDLTYELANVVNGHSEPPSQVEESPDSPSYDTATESSPVDSFETSSYESNYLLADIYPCKRRKHSDSSGYSLESQDSGEGTDILVKSIKLHTNSECIVMKDLGRESPVPSHLSLDMDIPFIDAEDLPVIKPNPEMSKTTQTDVSCFDPNSFGSSGSTLPVVERKLSNLSNVSNISNVSNVSFVSASQSTSPSSPSDSSSGLFLTPCGGATPVSDLSESSSLAPPKSSGLSKSPTVLKNLANFELYTVVCDPTAGKTSHSIQSEIPEGEEEEDEDEPRYVNVNGRTVTNSNSSDNSETSDNVTYVTVKSDNSSFLLSSDCDSDTYVTIRSDRSSFLERKSSDLSENSSSPYNTPPDTSSASFCTPPDTYSPILSRLTNYLTGNSENGSPKNLTRSTSPHSPRNGRNGHHSRHTNNSSRNHENTPPNPSPYSSPPYRQNYKCYSPLSQDSFSERESITIYNIEDENFPQDEDADEATRIKLIMFDSPKLEFYETNDSVENLEAFLETEEGLREPLLKQNSVEIPAGQAQEEYQEYQEAHVPESLSEFFENEEKAREPLSKTNSLESPSGLGDAKLFEKRSKRHPPLSRQNSTEEYYFLEPQDSCLNLSEDMSSPSTTPDTSNKTIIFKNKPLTVSNTIDLDDDDFPISESEIHINFNGSQTEILEIPVTTETAEQKTNYDMYSCRSEPCIPSISSSANLPSLARLREQSSNSTNDSFELSHTQSETNLSIPPEIIVSNVSSESEQSGSDLNGGIMIDFASNASDRSEIHFSDVNSSSHNLDDPCSNSDPLDNNSSDRSLEMPGSESARSHSLSSESSDKSSSRTSNKSSSGCDNLIEVCNQSDCPDPSSTPLECDDVRVPQSSRRSLPNLLSDPIEEHFIDIPEHLTSSSVGHLTVVDLSCSTGIISDHTQEMKDVPKNHTTQGI